MCEFLGFEGGKIFSGISSHLGIVEILPQPSKDIGGVCYSGILNLWHSENFKRLRGRILAVLPRGVLLQVSDTTDELFQVLREELLVAGDSSIRLTVTGGKFWGDTVVQKEFGNV